MTASVLMEYRSFRPRCRPNGCENRAPETSGWDPRGGATFASPGTADDAGSIVSTQDYCHQSKGVLARIRGDRHPAGPSELGPTTTAGTGAHCAAYPSGC